MYSRTTVIQAALLSLAVAVTSIPLPHVCISTIQDEIKLPPLEDVPDQTPAEVELTLTDDLLPQPTVESDQPLLDEILTQSPAEVEILVPQENLKQYPAESEEQPVLADNIGQPPVENAEADIIDVLLKNGTLASLSDGNIAIFLNNEVSVNSLTECFVDPSTCSSDGARNVVYVMNNITPGTLCLDCKDNDAERLNDVIYQIMSGLSTRYPEQWGIIFPKIFSTISAFTAQVAAKQELKLKQN